jgi:TRAP-type uncharacterized transport system fused permease subunit
MRTGVAAFRIALVGFTLPYLFVFRPQLLMLEPGGGVAPATHNAAAVLVAGLGIIPYAAAIAGRRVTNLGGGMRALLLVASFLLLLPGPHMLLAGFDLPLFDASGAVLFAILAVADWRAAGRLPPAGRMATAAGGKPPARDDR